MIWRGLGRGNDVKGSTAGSFDGLRTGSSTIDRAKKCWGGAMGKRLAVKLKQWLAFLQIRSAFATVTLTAGAANTFLHSFLNFSR